MKIVEFFKILFAFILVSIITNTASCEVTGNLSLDTNFTNSSSNIVTGLYGMTVTITTTIPTETNTTTSIAIMTTITTTTSTTSTTTTTSTTSTTTTTVLTREFESKNFRLNISKTNKIIDEFEDFLKEIIKFDSNKAKKTTEKIIEDITVNYDIWIENTTNVTITVLYNGSKKINNILIYQNVPKRFASTAKEMVIITKERVRILDDDPKILFISPSVEGGKEIEIILSVDKRIKKDIIDEFETAVFADGFALEVDVIFFVIPIIIIIVLLIAYYAYENKRRVGSYRYSFKRRTSIWFIIKIKLKNIKQKIKDKFRKEESKFRYQYKI